MSEHPYATTAKELDSIASRWRDNGHLGDALQLEAAAKVLRIQAGEPKYLTRQEVLDAHAQFGQLDRKAVKEHMGPNWPKEWDAAEMFR